MVLTRLPLLLDKGCPAVGSCEYEIPLAIKLNSIYLLLELVHRRVLIFQGLRNAGHFVLDAVLRVVSSRRISLGLRPGRQFLDCCSLSAHIVVA